MPATPDYSTMIQSSTFTSSDTLFPDGVVYRIRLDAHGSSVEHCRYAMERVVALLRDINGLSEERPTCGVEVYERDVAEPEGSTAYKGRMVLHPRIG